MNTLKVVTSRIMTLQVANAGGQIKSKTQTIRNVGGLGFGPDMAVVAFVHAIHRFGLRMRRGYTNGWEDKHLITIKARRKEIHIHDVQSVIIYLLEDVFPTGHRSQSTQTLKNGHVGSSSGWRKRRQMRWGIKGGTDGGWRWLGNGSEKRGLITIKGIGKVYDSVYTRLNFNFDHRRDV